MRGAGTAGPLLERNGELARIASALAEARNERGRFVVVEGPAGIGKTALLAAVRARAAADGMRVLRSRGTELERDFAFGVVRQLFEPPLAEASELERADLLQAAAGGAASVLGVAGASPVDVARAPIVDPSFAILHGLYWLCTNLAARAPLCIVVDDAHWADTPSLRYLAFLLTRLEELAVALVVAARPSEPGADGELLATLTADPSAEVIRLLPLTGVAVGQVVESRLGATPDPAFVDACLRVTRGTPFLLGRLLDALDEAGIAPAASAVPEVERTGTETVGRSLRLRLERLPDHAARLARALAILEQSDLLHAARLAGLDEAEAADAVDLLAGAGILEPVRPLTFVHPIVRSGIYADLSGTERAQGHRRAAQLLAELPVGHEHVAQHLLASDPAADRWVVEQLLEAGRAAGRQGAPDLQAIYLRRALEEPPSAEQQPELLLELGIAEASAGLDGWDEHFRQAVDGAPTPSAAVGPAQALARALNRSQRFGEAVDVLDRAVSALGPGDGELALRLDAAAVSVGTNDLDAPPSVAARRSALLDRVRHDTAVPPDVLYAAAYFSILENEPADAGMELALLAEERMAAGSEGFAADRATSGVGGLFARLRMSLIWGERYAYLLPELDASIAQSRATGDGGMLAYSLGCRAWVALRRGELSAAEADTRTALDAPILPVPLMYRLLNAGLLVETLVERGELDAAEAELALLEPGEGFGSLVGSIACCARARLWVEQGRIDEGLAELLGRGALLTRAGITCPGVLPWRSEAALAHLALGERDPAQRLAGEELELARAFGAPRALGVAQRAAAVVEGGERGESLLRAALDSFERSGARLERARALADLGALLRRRNRRTEARELLREALDAAHRVGAGRLASRAETELRATGARPRRLALSGVDSLTASERRIAELAGQGLTNREIAQLLFVTARTVEGHLTSVFRKLGLDSRTELATALEERAPVSA